MILQIPDVLDQPILAAIRDALSDEDCWIDGGATATGRARTVKRNQQADRDSPEIAGVAEKIRQMLLGNSLLRKAAQPDRIARIILSRYGEGMSYGAHVDAAYIEGLRTDLSFTLFLNGPEEYEGGELVIDSAGAEDAVKLPAGSLVLYPSTSVHRVAEVTSGVRLAAVGWIKSRIRSAEHRDMIFELERALADLAVSGAPGGVRDRLANLRNNLLRAFGG